MDCAADHLPPAARHPRAAALFAIPIDPIRQYLPNNRPTTGPFVEMTTLMSHDASPDSVRTKPVNADLQVFLPPSSQDSATHVSPSLLSASGLGRKVSYELKFL